MKKVLELIDPDRPDLPAGAPPPGSDPPQRGNLIRTKLHRRVHRGMEPKQDEEKGKKEEIEPYGKGDQDYVGETGRWEGRGEVGGRALGRYVRTVKGMG